MRRQDLPFAMLCFGEKGVMTNSASDAPQTTAPIGRRVLVCGGRSFWQSQQMATILAAYPIVTLIHGGASGADRLAALWAGRQNIDCLQFLPNWLKHGKSAGPLRNQRMIDDGKPDLVIAFPGGRGTADMVRGAKFAGIEVREISL